MSKKSKIKGEPRNQQVIERLTNEALSTLPTDFLVDSISQPQIFGDQLNIRITGRRLSRGFTVEATCLPDRPKGRYATIFSQPMTVRWTKPCARLGFCNGELRPHFEVLLEGHSTTIEAVSGTVITPTEPVHLAGTFDGTKIRLYVDAKLAAETPAHGTLAAPQEPAGSAIGCRSPSDPGDHYAGTLFYIRVWRTARTQEQLRKNMNTFAPPPNPDPNAPNDGDARTVPNLAQLSGDPDCELWYPFSLGPYGPAGRPLLTELATRVLRAAGIRDEEQGDLATRPQRASATIIDVCDQLERLIDRTESNERDVLRFFRERPHAAFLLEPDQNGAIWREQQLQGYGQIDFVFRKTNGRYVALEIEDPNAALFREDDEFSKQFDHAIDQVERWRLGAIKHQDVAENILGLKDIQSPDGAVVMGRQREFKNPQRSERWHDRCACSPLQFLTWDDVLARGRSFARRLGNPQLPDADWAQRA